MSLQAFKENDTTEGKVRDAFLPTLELIEGDLDAFKEGAYACWILGEVLANLNASPLADQVSLAVFKESFYAVHNYFKRPGTFEFYLEICRVIWGGDVEVEFTIPNPGHLQIGISALEVTLFNFMARRIVDAAYVYEQVVDQDGNHLVFQVPQGPKTQNETDALFFELSPVGIFVEAELS